MSDFSLTSPHTLQAYHLHTVQEPKSSNMDRAAFDAAWQAMSLDSVDWGKMGGPSVVAEMANRQQLMLSQAYDMTGLQLEGKSLIETNMELTRKRIEILQAETSLNLSWSSMKEVRKGIETVMNSK